MTALRTLRLIGTLAMLGVVIAGALGYGDETKLTVAAGGAFAAVILKACHLVA